MAQLAITLSEVVGAETNAPLASVRGLPVFGIADVDTGWVLDAVEDILAQRFPTPNAAVAYLGYEAEFYNFENPFNFPPFPIEGLAGTPVPYPLGVSGQPIAGAFAQEGLYSEPTVGQIWPRLA